MVFPKPQTALEYTYSVSQPETYKKFVDDLKHFLKRKCTVGGESALTTEPSGMPLEAAFLEFILPFCSFPFKHRQLGRSASKLSCKNKVKSVPYKTVPLSVSTFLGMEHAASSAWRVLCHACATTSLRLFISRRVPKWGWHSCHF